MEIGQVYAFLPGRPVAPEQFAPGREPAARPEDDVTVTVERSGARRARRAEARIIEGELLDRRQQTATQTTQEFLQSRQYATDSAQSQRQATRSSFSNSNRQAVGQYLDHVRPEPRQVLTQGRSIDTYV